MSSKHGLVQLHNFINLLAESSLLVMLEAFLLKHFTDFLLKILITYTRGLKSWEQIGNQTLEKRHIIVNELWHVHVSEGSHQHNVFGKVGESSLEGTCHHQHGLQSTELEVVMVLL